MLITISLVLGLLVFVLTNILIENSKIHQVMQYRVFERLKLDKLMYKVSNAGIEYYVKQRKEVLSHPNKVGNINKKYKDIYFCASINLKNNLYGFYKVRFILDNTDRGVDRGVDRGIDRGVDRDRDRDRDKGDSKLFVGQSLLTVQIRDLSDNFNQSNLNNCNFNSQDGLLVTKSYVLA